MSDLHNKFVSSQNIKNFELRLLTETDVAKRDLIVKLLVEERARIGPLPAEPKP